MDYDEYDPARDQMAMYDGGRKSLSPSRFGKVLIAISWVALGLCAVAALNLMLDRPWF